MNRNIMTAHHYSPEEIAHAVSVLRSFAGSHTSAAKAAAVRRNGLLGGRSFSGGRIRTIAREYIRKTYGDLRKIKDAARRAAINAEAREYATNEALRRTKENRSET